MRFIVEDRLYGVFPGLKIGVLVCGIDNKKYGGDDGLERVVEELRAGFSYGKPQDHPHVKIWREAFGKIGISPSKYYSSIESLLRRALKGGAFPRINPVVDLYNAISLKYLVPMGGHAVDPLEGDIGLCFAKGGEAFVPMDSGQAETAEPGEVIYRDGKEVLTRRWVWRQCDKDKVTEQTQRLFVPIDLMEGVADGTCERIMEEMGEALARNRYGTVLYRDILTREHPATDEFPLG